MLKGERAQSRLEDARLAWYADGERALLLSQTLIYDVETLLTSPFALVAL